MAVNAILCAFLIRAITSNCIFMNLKVFLFSAALLPCVAFAQARVSSPDGNLEVSVSGNGGKPTYSVTYKGKTIIEESPLGVKTTIGDFSSGLTLTDCETDAINTNYTLSRSKTSRVHYVANEAICRFSKDGKNVLDVTFRVSNNDVAFRYVINKTGECGSCIVESEATGFDFPSYATTFLTPQSDAMIGWKRTKPSYEELYKADEPVGTPSQYGQGYTFPALFRIGDDGWALISETGVDGSYCASHLSDGTSDGLYTIAYPMPEENNGNGNAAPGVALPAATPWRTITVGDNLKPIVETTVPWDVVEPRYETAWDYKFGRSTWSWIVWQDASINYDDQIKFIDLAAAMGYEYTLIDSGWDVNIGRDRMKELADYGRSKGVELFVWYSSSGYWNDIVQSPTNLMCNPIVRKREMKWLREIGAKGIKVDFFGGDKQETMRLYEAILSDADDYGLMVIFHGCTLPRGWERMYPNYVGSEAVLASENMVFNQSFCDGEAFNAALHPFIRNTVGCMEFGGTFLNKRLNKTNDGGSERKTTDVFELATAVLFQNPIQNFALTPNNLEDASAVAIEFMKYVPTTWDETRFIDGYPGKYCVLARRHADRWYVAAINATDETLKVEVKMPMLAGRNVDFYYDGRDKAPEVKNLEVGSDGKVKLELVTGGGAVLVK